MLGETHEYKWIQFKCKHIWHLISICASDFNHEHKWRHRQLILDQCRPRITCTTPIYAPICVKIHIKPVMVYIRETDSIRNKCEKIDFSGQNWVDITRFEIEFIIEIFLFQTDYNIFPFASHPVDSRVYRQVKIVIYSFHYI